MATHLDVDLMARCRIRIEAFGERKAVAASPVAKSVLALLALTLAAACACVRTSRSCRRAESGGHR